MNQEENKINTPYQLKRPFTHSEPPGVIIKTAYTDKLKHKTQQKSNKNTNKVKIQQLHPETGKVEN